MADKLLRNIRNVEDLERATGIEPVSLAWKAKVLPLHNARADLSLALYRGMLKRGVSVLRQMHDLNLRRL